MNPKFSQGWSVDTVEFECSLSDAFDFIAKQFKGHVDDLSKVNNQMVLTIYCDGGAFICFAFDKICWLASGNICLFAATDTAKESFKNLLDMTQRAN
jgi:hypothetical protein